MSLNKHLTEEQKENLAELLEHEGLTALLADIEHLIETSFEGDVLKCTLDNTSASQRELVLRKAYLTGARRLYDATVRRITTLKSKKD